MIHEPKPGSGGVHSCSLTLSGGWYLVGIILVVCMACLAILCTLPVSVTVLTALPAANHILTPFALPLYYTCTSTVMVQQLPTAFAELHLLYYSMCTQIAPVVVQLILQCTVYRCRHCIATRSTEI